MATSKQRHWLIRVRPIELAVFVKVLLRIKRQEVEASGVRMWVDPASTFGSRLMAEGNYDAELTDVCRRLFPRYTKFLDLTSYSTKRDDYLADLLGSKDPLAKEILFDAQETSFHFPQRALAKQRNRQTPSWHPACLIRGIARNLAS